ncbi:gliding motility-associated C-terminal domain-containing protein [Ekhidna sp.]|uniref:T9SS type B sorting domain-containing protein n=1 Tax=Ekhidna sp. TaxID=2608089 RepID=UPI003B506848
MKKLLIISLFFLICQYSTAQLHIQGSALMHISEGANLEVGGDLENEGVLQNNGTLSLYGNWTINNNFNGLTGKLQFLGGANQNVSPPQLRVDELIINQEGDVNFSGSEYTVINRLELKFGNIIIGDNTKFVLEGNARVVGGSEFSYFEGTLIHKGIGEKIFPLGDDSYYNPIHLLDVTGADTEISARFDRENPVDPIPGDSLLGVSHLGLWNIKVLSGNPDGALVRLEFNGHDLSDLRITNNIRHRVNAPVVGYSNNPAEEFQSLGVDQLLDSDSLTFGTIFSEKRFNPNPNLDHYFAVALAPRIPSEGLYYIPEAFSPNASDFKNQTFKIFGEQIVEDGFSLQIYNRYGIVVYSTESFVEANSLGWDGVNQKTGEEEPAGVYYYTVRFQFNTGLPIQEKGAFYLVK